MSTSAGTSAAAPARHARTLELASGLTVLLLGLAVLLFLLWASDKGFDVTDEGFYLLSAQFPQDILFWPTHGHVYLAWLFRLVGQDVVAMRLAGVLLTLCSAAVFACGAYAAARSSVQAPAKMPYAAAVPGMAALGVMLGYAALLMTPSYNTVNVIAVNCAGGLFLWALARSTDGSRKNCGVLALATGAGMLAGVAFFAKFAAGLALLVLLCLSWVALPVARTRDRLLGPVAVLLGTGLWMLVHFLVFQPMDVWWQSFQAGLEHARRLVYPEGYDAWSAIDRYFNEVRELLGSAFTDLLPLHAGMLAGFASLEFIRHRRGAMGSPERILLIVFALAAGLLFARQSWRGGMDHYADLTRFYLSWILLLAHAVLASCLYARGVPAGRPPATARLGLVFGVLLLLPFAGAFGTSSSIATGMSYHLLPWFALLFGLLLVLARRHPINQWHVAVALVGLAAFASVQVVSGMVTNPYRLAAGIMAQTRVTAIGQPPSNLRLDPRTGEFFDALNAILSANGFHPGDDVLAFFHLPGAVFAVGGRSPTIPWYSGYYPGKDRVLLKALARGSPGRLRRAFILQVEGDPNLRLPDLSAAGLDFPAAYTLCGELAIPYTWTRGVLRIWKPA